MLQKLCYLLRYDTSLSTNITIYTRICFVCSIWTIINLVMHCRNHFIAKSPEILKRAATKRAFIKVCFRNFQKQKVFSLFRHYSKKKKKTNLIDIDQDEFLFWPLTRIYCDLWKLKPWGAVIYVWLISKYGQKQNHGSFHWTIRNIIMYIYLCQCQTLVHRTINRVSLHLIRTNVLIMDDTISTLNPS